VVSFGGYETTVALLLKQVFGLTLIQITLFFAYIGVVLSLVQGGLVRRMSGRVSEKGMATVGAALTVVGFLLLAWSTWSNLFWLVMIASAIEVSGFAFMTPSLQSLISRRSDPAKQGGILGVSQGVSALARIIGPLMAVPLFTNVSHTSPYFASIGLMVLGLAALLIGARGGRDYGTPAEVAPYE
jgi:MFS family permease